MAEAKVTKKSKYSVVMKHGGRDFYSVVVLEGTNNVAWRSAAVTDQDIALKAAKEMAKFLGAKVIDQT